MKKTILLLFFALTLGCNKYPPITEEMVIEKVYDLFRAIESENEDRSKFFDVVTDDFLIYEIGQEINKDDFLEFVESFNVIEDDWELSDFKVSLDYNSAHVYFKNKGRFGHSKCKWDGGPAMATIQPNPNKFKRIQANDIIN